MTTAAELPVEVPTTPIHEVINSEIANTQSELEELQENLEQTETKAASIEQYTAVLEETLDGGINGQLDHYSKQLLTMGMEHLGYPLSLNTIASQYNGSTERQKLAIALESMGDIAKKVIDTIKEMFKRFMVLLDELTDKVKLFISGNESKIDELKARLSKIKGTADEVIIYVNSPEKIFANGEMAISKNGTDTLIALTKYLGKDYIHGVHYVLNLMESMVKSNELVPNDKRAVSEIIGKILLKNTDVFSKSFPGKVTESPDTETVYTTEPFMDGKSLQLIVTKRTLVSGTPIELKVVDVKAKSAVEEITIPPAIELIGYLASIQKANAHLELFVTEKAAIKQKIVSFERTLEHMLTAHDRKVDEGGVTEDEKYIGYFNLTSAKILTTMIDARFTGVLSYLIRCISVQLTAIEQFTRTLEKGVKEA